MKIEDLLVRYNSVISTSALTDSLKKEVIGVSLCFGVLTPFTSFSIGTSGNEKTDTGGGKVSSGVSEAIAPEMYDAVTAFPNPFTLSTSLCFSMNDDKIGGAQIRIYSVAGKLIRTLHLAITGSGAYKITWDGRDEAGTPVSAGKYLCVLAFKNQVMAGHLIKL